MKNLIILVLLLTGCSEANDFGKMIADTPTALLCGYEKRDLYTATGETDMCYLLTPGDNTAITPVNSDSCDDLDDWRKPRVVAAGSVWRLWVVTGTEPTESNLSTVPTPCNNR